MLITFNRKFRIYPILFLILLIAGSSAWFILRQEGSADTTTTQSGSISGKVIDQQTENPIPNAEIQISNSTTLGRSKIILNTDTKGEFKETDLSSDDNYRVIISKVVGFSTTKLQNTIAIAKVEIGYNTNIFWKLTSSTDPSPNTVQISHPLPDNNIKLNVTVIADKNIKFANTPVVIPGYPDVLRTNQKGDVEIPNPTSNFVPLFFPEINNKHNPNELGAEYLITKNGQTNYEVGITLENASEQTSSDLTVIVKTTNSSDSLDGFRVSFYVNKKLVEYYTDNNGKVNIDGINSGPYEIMINKAGFENNIEYVVLEPNKTSRIKSLMLPTRQPGKNYLLLSAFLEEDYAENVQFSGTADITLIGKSFSDDTLTGHQITIKDIDFYEGQALVDSIPVDLFNNEVVYITQVISAGGGYGSNEEQFIGTLGSFNRGPEILLHITSTVHPDPVINGVAFQFIGSGAKLLYEEDKDNNKQRDRDYIWEAIAEEINSLKKIVLGCSKPELIKIYSGKPPKAYNTGNYAAANTDGTTITYFLNIIDNVSPDYTKLLIAITDHEWGHDLDFCRSYSESNKNWLNVFDATKNQTNLLIPSSYALNNSLEFFAESFQYYLSFSARVALLNQLRDGTFSNSLLNNSVLYSMIRKSGNLQEQNILTFIFKFLVQDNPKGVDVFQDPFPCKPFEQPYFDANKDGIWESSEILAGDFLKCSQPANLKGKVIDANGKPIAFASVALPSKGSDYTGVTFLDGTYIIPNIPLSPDVAQESVSAIATYSQEPTCPSQTLTPILQSGQTTTQDFQLNCRPEVLALGTITDQATGQPIAGATVNIDKPTPTIITANSQGQFIIPCNPTSPCPANGINFTLTASSSADFNSQSIMLNYAKYAITTNFALIPISRSTTDNTPPAITKLTYQKQTYKMYFWWQAKDKEDASKKIKYSYKLDNGSWSAWDSNIIKDFDLSGLKSNPTTFAIKAKDSSNLESSVQELKIKKTW